MALVGQMPLQQLAGVVGLAIGLTADALSLVIHFTSAKSDSSLTIAASNRDLLKSLFIKAYKDLKDRRPACGRAIEDFVDMGKHLTDDDERWLEEYSKGYAKKYKPKK